MRENTLEEYSPENSSDIDRNRPEPLAKCIDGSLNSKNPWRTSCLGENFLSVTQHCTLQMGSLYKLTYVNTGICFGFIRESLYNVDYAYTFWGSGPPFGERFAPNRAVLQGFFELSGPSIHFSNASGRFLSISEEFLGDYRLFVGDY